MTHPFTTAHDAATARPQRRAGGSRARRSVGRLAPLTREAARQLRAADGPVEVLWTVAAAARPGDPKLLVGLLSRAGGLGPPTDDHDGKRRRRWWLGVRAAAALAAIGLSAARNDTNSHDRAHDDG